MGEPPVVAYGWQGWLQEQLEKVQFGVTDLLTAASPPIPLRSAVAAAPNAVWADVNAWPGGGIEHHPGHGEWIRVLRASGFVMDALHELYPPTDADGHEFYEIVTPEWARRWPAEDV